MFKNLFHLITIFVAIIPFSGCKKSPAGVEVEWTPFGILRVSVDSWGDVKFALDPELEIPTPIGVFNLKGVVDPIKIVEQFKKESKSENILVIRFNGEDRVYDLHGQDFNVEFESGYYKTIRVYKSGKDLFLEIERVSPSPAAATNPPSVFPPSDRRFAPAGSQLLTNGRGLTDGTPQMNGDMQVEWYCENSGYGVDHNDNYWFCLNRDGSRAFRLEVADFDTICQATYSTPHAFAIQDGPKPIPAFRWRCYTY